jgi:hypothetical protein
VIPGGLTAGFPTEIINRRKRLYTTVFGILGALERCCAPGQRHWQISTTIRVSSRI